MPIPRFEMDDLVKVISVPRREHFLEEGRIVGRIAESDLPSRVVYAVQLPSGALPHPFFGFELELAHRGMSMSACGS